MNSNACLNSALIYLKFGKVIDIYNCGNKINNYANQTFHLNQST